MAGRRHRIQIDRPKNRRSSSGRMEETWELVADRVPARIFWVSGKEYVASQSVQGEVVARIEIRWMRGIEPKMRVICEDRVFNISAVLPDTTDRRKLHLMVSVGVSQG